MIELKCPFCGQKLEKDCDWVYRCPNHKCKAFGFSFGARELWQALIDTMKKLDIAINAMESAKDHNIINCVVYGIDPRTDDTNVTLCNALKQIYQKEQR